MELEIGYRDLTDVECDVVDRADSRCGWNVAIRTTDAASGDDDLTDVQILDVANGGTTTFATARDVSESDALYDNVDALSLFAARGLLASVRPTADDLVLPSNVALIYALDNALSALDALDAAYATNYDERRSYCAQLVAEYRRDNR
jgi:hypothetical protein